MCTVSLVLAIQSAGVMVRCHVLVVMVEVGLLQLTASMSKKVWFRNNFRYPSVNVSFNWMLPRKKAVLWLSCLGCFWAPRCPKKRCQRLHFLSLKCVSSSKQGATTGRSTGTWVIPWSCRNHCSISFQVQVSRTLIRVHKYIKVCKHQEKPSRFAGENVARPSIEMSSQPDNCLFWRMVFDHIYFFFWLTPETIEKYLSTVLLGFTFESLWAVTATRVNTNAIRFRCTDFDVPCPQPRNFYPPMVRLQAMLQRPQTEQVPMYKVWPWRLHSLVDIG